MFLKIKQCMKYFLPFLLLILIWFQVAVLPAGAEIVLMAFLVFSFILPIDYFLSLLLMAGLVLDYISALPVGILTISLVVSVLLFIFLRRIFNLNVKSLFINSVIALLLYEFSIWSFFKITAWLTGHQVAINVVSDIFFNDKFFIVLAFNFTGIIFLSYWFGRKKAYERFIKI